MILVKKKVAPFADMNAKMPRPADIENPNITNVHNTQNDAENSAPTAPVITQHTLFTQAQNEGDDENKTSNIIVDKMKNDLSFKISNDPVYKTFHMAEFNK